jgi:methionyl-tRNA formyltransferase
MSKVRVCFLGTPEIAKICLQSLLDDPHYEVVGVVTQPDRPAGRKMVLTPTPVKLLAQERGIPVISPESVNKDPILDEVKKWNAEVAVVVAFGQIVSQNFLDLFHFGCVNVHASILPRWRGAAPIQRAIEYGDSETGVALQKMVRELDAGDIIGIRKISLPTEMNAQELYGKLAELGAQLLQVELMDYVRGNLVPTPQDVSVVPQWALYAKKIDKAEAEIQWNKTAEQIHNKVRAFAMGPGTWTSFAGKKIKIHKTFCAKKNGVADVLPGTVTDVTDKSIFVSTGDGLLELLEVQPESRNRQSVMDFLKGNPIKKGDQFGLQ